MPPGVGLDSVLVVPAHKVVVPEIAPGVAATVKVVVTYVPNVYVMVAVPAEIPVTTPVDKPTEAIDGSLLDHVPPVVVSLKVDVAPTHALVIPLIGSSAKLAADIINPNNVSVICFFILFCF